MQQACQGLLVHGAGPEEIPAHSWNGAAILKAVQQAWRPPPGPAGAADRGPHARIPAHTAHQIFILLPLAQTVLCKLLRIADFLPRRLEILLLQLLALPQDLLNSDLQA